MYNKPDTSYAAITVFDPYGSKTVFLTEQAFIDEARGLQHRSEHKRIMDEVAAKFECRLTRWFTHNRHRFLPDSTR